jgi:hypothetical protein
MSASAEACTCGDRLSGGSETDQKSERLSKAEIVVTGRVVGMRAGRDIGDFAMTPNVASATSTGRAVVATFAIDEVVKGNVTGTEVEVMSGFGTGDCGLAGGFLGAIAYDQKITMQLTSLPGRDRPIFYSDICSYLDVPPKKRPPQ